MAEPTPYPVLFTVTDRFVNVHMDGVSVCQFGVTPDGNIIVAFPATMMTAQLELVDGSIVRQPLARIATEMIYQEMDETLAIPRYHRTRLGRAVPPVRHRVRVTDTGTQVTSNDVEVLIEAIVASYIAEPNQTKTRTAAITNSLSERFDIPKMSIAGVRAALTRGAYGATQAQRIHERQRDIAQRGTQRGA